MKIFVVLLYAFKNHQTAHKTSMLCCAFDVPKQ